jgi:hypothetical protein
MAVGLVQPEGWVGRRPTIREAYAERIAPHRDADAEAAATKNRGTPT